MVQRTSVALSDYDIKSIFITTDALLNEAVVPDPSAFTLSRGFVCGLEVRRNLIELRTTNFYGIGSPSITVSYNSGVANALRNASNGTLLPGFSSVLAINKIAEPLFDDPPLRFPNNFTPIINVTTSQAGANVLIPNSVAAASNNGQRLVNLISQNAGTTGGGKSGGPNIKWLYFPNGTYYLDRRIAWTRDFTIIGESREGTILRLIDNAPGFNNTTNRLPFVGFADIQKDQTGFGFNVFANNLTIDSGNNPECIGVSFYSNNTGSMTNILVKGNGHVGLGCRSGSFPSTVGYLEVQGFRYGVVGCSGSMFYCLKVKNQSIAGFVKIENNVLTSVPELPNIVPFLGGDSGQGGSTIGAVHFISEQTTANVPAILLQAKNSNPHMASFSNCNIYGTGNYAVINGKSLADSPRADFLLLENAMQRGYKAFVRYGTNGSATEIAGSDRVQDYSHHDFSFSNERPIKGASKRFPFTPKFYLPDPSSSTWKSVEDSPYNATTSGTAHAGINAALADPSVDVVYFPQRRGTYNISETLVVQGNRNGRNLFFVNFGTAVDLVDGAFNNVAATKPVVRFDSIGGGSLIMSRFNTNLFTKNNLNHVLFEHNSGMSCFFFDCKTESTSETTSSKLWGYRVSPSFSGKAGRVSVYDCLINLARFSRQQVVVLHNANWQVIGKFEKANSFIEVTDGAKVQNINSRHENTRVFSELTPVNKVTGTNSFMVLYSTWIDPSRGGNGEGPLVDVTDGGLFYGCVGHHAQISQAFPLVFRTNRGGTISQWLKKEAPKIPSNVNTRSLLFFSHLSAGGTVSAAVVPKVTSAVVGDSAEPLKLFIAFDVPLNSAFIPAASAFSCTVAGANRAISSVAMSGAFTFLLTLASAPAAGQAVAVSYTPPGSNRLRSKQGGNVASFNIPVKNIT